MALKHCERCVLMHVVVYACAVPLTLSDGSIRRQTPVDAQGSLQHLVFVAKPCGLSPLCVFMVMLVISDAEHFRQVMNAFFCYNNTEGRKQNIGGIKQNLLLCIAWFLMNLHYACGWPFEVAGAQGCVASVKFLGTSRWHSFSLDLSTSVFHLRRSDEGQGLNHTTGRGEGKCGK